MKQFRTDARVSGQFYRGELWLVSDDNWELIYITPRQYVTVEDAAGAARRYITEYRRTGRRVERVPA